MRKIRTGDDVIVIAGRDKGKRGSVLQVVTGGRVLVDGVNVVKRHTRANPAKGQAGGIIEKEAPLAISNVALYDPTAGKASRVGIKTLDDGSKVRFYKASGEVIDTK